LRKRKAFFLKGEEPLKISDTEMIAEESYSTKDSGGMIKYKIPLSTSINTVDTNKVRKIGFGNYSYLGYK